MNTTAYKIFVMQASEAGQEIEIEYPTGRWTVCTTPKWSWDDDIYRIKLPSGWEYVIEDNNIDFREPIECEYIYCRFHGNKYEVMFVPKENKYFGKFPIIKKIDNTKELLCL